MGDFNRNKSFGKRRDFGNRGGSDRPQLYSATCANCGNACEVPFKPNGSKPVLCRDCFRNSNGSDNRNFERRDNDRPRFENRHQSQPSFQSQPQPNYQRQLDELNAKVDKILEILSSAMEEVDEEIEEEPIEEVQVAEKVVETVEEKPKKKAKAAKATDEEPKTKKATKKKTAKKE